ncbi:MAG: hypothetical protein K0U74_16000 [Alphaproteobacteria bacterium]|nr:hypothetical protein [Alphaproteobacteria bacterium]
MLALLDRLLFLPIVHLADKAVGVFLDPKKIAKRLRSIAPAEQINQSVGFAVAALSLSIFLYATAFWLLGVSGPEEFYFWAFNLILIFAVSLITGATTSMLRLAPFAWTSALTIYSFTASTLIGAVVLFGASFGIWLVSYYGLAPLPKLSVGAWADHEVWSDVAMNIYFQCLRADNYLYSLLYAGMGGPFEGLIFPVGELSYLIPAAYLLAVTAVFRLIIAVELRRSWVPALAAAAVALGTGVLILYSTVEYGQYLHVTSNCGHQSIEDALVKSGESQASYLVQLWRKEIGVENNGVTLEKVEREKKTVVLYFLLDPNHFASDKEGDEFEGRIRGRIGEYCKSEWGSYWRQVKLSEVWIVRYRNSDVLKRYIVSSDQCRG